LTDNVGEIFPFCFGLIYLFLPLKNLEVLLNNKRNIFRGALSAPVLMKQWKQINKTA